MIDAGETNPLWGNGADDFLVVDTDFDGLSDGEELAFGSDPNDNDSDDDGVVDGDELNPTGDADGDGLNNAADPDSDNDGIPDGTELGFGCGIPVPLNCTEDGDDGATTTDSLNPDSDGGGVLDGVEDKNQNGVVDPGEGDPADPTDDVCMQNTDCVGGQAGVTVCDPTTNECVEAKCDASVVCPQPDACHLPGACDPTLGLCAYPNKQDGAACDDGNPCTIESCKSGGCFPQSALDGTACEGGVCIAGNCFLDSIQGSGGGTSEGGSSGQGGSGGGEGGAGGEATGEGGDAEGGSGGGDGGSPNASDEDAKFTLFGGACSAPASGGRSGGALAVLVALAGLTMARRRSRRAASGDRSRAG